MAGSSEGCHSERKRRGADVSGAFAKEKQMVRAAAIQADDIRRDDRSDGMSGTITGQKHGVRQELQMPHLRTKEKERRTGGLYDGIRLVAIDMDGTILGRNGAVPQANIDAVRRAQADGIELVVCTGRSHHDAKLPLREAGLHLNLLCMNGAAWYDRDGVQYKKTPVSHEKTAMILALAEQHHLLVDLMTDQGSMTTADEAEFRQCFEEGELLPVAEVSYEAIRGRFRFVTVKDVLEGSEAIYKISLICPVRDQHVLSGVREKLLQAGGLNVASSASNNLEITDAFASKGQALRQYAKSLGIALSETAAIGDSENDLSMMQLPLGLRAVMADAAECIQVLADVKTASNDEGGVAMVLNRISESAERRQERCG